MNPNTSPLPRSTTPEPSGRVDRKNSRVDVVGLVGTASSHADASARRARVRVFYTSTINTISGNGFHSVRPTDVRIKRTNTIRTLSATTLPNIYLNTVTSSYFVKNYKYYSIRIDRENE